MSTNTWYQAQRSGIEACCRQLVAEGASEPLSTDEEETKSWNLRELASLAEGHFHEQLDVTPLSDDERLAHERHVSYDGRPLASPHNRYCHPFWLFADGRRVGTIAIGTMISGLDLISISSLYVDPADRRRNIARRALEAVFKAAIANGAGGIRLDTNWTWQPSVRFYARIGMWVWMWKHNLVFTWQKEMPPYRVEIGESEARFLIQQDDRWRAVVTARHLGDRLGWESTVSNAITVRRFAAFREPSRSTSPWQGGRSFAPRRRGRVATTGRTRVSPRALPTRSRSSRP